MDGVKSALVGSIAARCLAAVAGLIAVPIYLRYLGAEGYGVVGVFTSLQAVVAFMDFGLPATLTRQLATLGRERAMVGECRNLLRTFEIAYLGIALLIALGLAALAPWVGSHWVNAQALTTGQLVWALQLAGLSLAAAWPANLYAAGLGGLQRQVELAASSAAFAVMRVALAVLFLWWRPTLESFFFAQLLASALQSGGTGAQLWHVLQLREHRPRADWRFLFAARGFAGGMTLITISSIVLSQLDKLVLSHLLPLSEFGVYSVAAALAATLTILIAPMFSIIYPRMSAIWDPSSTAGPGVPEFFHFSAQLMALLLLPVGAVLACNPQSALFALTGDASMALQAAPLLTLLVVATTCNGVMNIPYALQLAAGWTSLSVWLNAASIIIMAPATWWAVNRYGALGGAAVWAFLNVAVMVLTPQLLHTRLLPSEKWRWYMRDLLVPTVVSLGVALALALLSRAPAGSRWMAASSLAVFWLLTAAATLASLPRLWPRVSGIFVK